MKKTQLIRNIKFFLMMSTVVTVWASAFSLIKIGLKELTFLNLTIMRFFIASIVLGFILIFRYRSFSKLQKRDIIPIFILGFFGVIVYHLGLNFGEQYISAGAASLIIATVPIQIVILALIFLKEKITIPKFIGITLSLAGVALISIWGTSDSTLKIEYIFGAIAVLISALMAAFYTIAGKKMLQRYNALSLTIYAILLGSIGLIPFISTSLFNQVSQMSTIAWLAIISLGFFSTVIGYLFWYAALQLKSATDVSVYLYAIPVVSTIISYFMFDDKITLIFLLGGSLVLIGLIVVNYYQIKNNKKIK